MDSGYEPFKEFSSSGLSVWENGKVWPEISDTIEAAFVKFPDPRGGLVALAFDADT